MSIYEFLKRLDADPFDPVLTALFLGNGTEPAQQMREKDPPQNVPTAADGQALFPLA